MVLHHYFLRLPDHRPTLILVILVIRFLPFSFFLLLKLSTDGLAFPLETHPLPVSPIEVWSSRAYRLKAEHHASTPVP